MKRTLMNWLGLSGVVSFLSYAAAVVLSPLAYPGYNWMSQAVSDLSAANAPSRFLWNQLSCLYGIGGMICLTLVCVFIQGKLNKTLRVGIYTFTVMNAVSYVGYSLFPLSSSGYAGTFQDIMHAYVVTTLVVLLSIISLVIIMVEGFKSGRYRTLAIWAAIVLSLMFTGAIGTGLVPRAIFGIFERFSAFAASGFTMILGIYLFNSFDPVFKSP